MTDLIAAIGTVTKDSGDKIAAARAAYDKLTAAQKELVSNYHKLTAAEAQNTDFGATLMMNGEAVKDQSSVHVLYSGITSKWKIYSSTTTPPSEAGRYTMTVTVLGGNYLASPINRSFQITK